MGIKYFVLAGRTNEEPDTAEAFDSIDAAVSYASSVVELTRGKRKRLRQHRFLNLDRDKTGKDYIEIEASEEGRS